MLLRDLADKRVIRMLQKQAEMHDVVVSSQSDGDDFGKIIKSVREGVTNGKRIKPKGSSESKKRGSKPSCRALHSADRDHFDAPLS